MRTPHPEADFWYRSDEITVYPLHLSRPIHRAQHYIGSCVDLDRRLKEHQRKYPLYRIDERTLTALFDVIPDSIVGELSALCGFTFRRKHTALQVIHAQIGMTCFDRAILSAARRHTTNGLIMKANREGILWYVAKTWGATREFEFWLKRQKNTPKFCPICCGHEEEVPF